ncbi:unnamed protein product [Toxocara canis]|uniref:Uncharacterized protein n=1 Tax=Toxocara canis TaxID=6265 RepID=A0A3P7GSJ7_TOXCA|nr:unnamed protein product [Toxocara canis]
MDEMLPLDAIHMRLVRYMIVGRRCGAPTV